MMARFNHWLGRAARRRLLAVLTVLAATGLAGTVFSTAVDARSGKSASAKSSQKSSHQSRSASSKGKASSRKSSRQASVSKSKALKARRKSLARDRAPSDTDQPAEAVAAKAPEPKRALLLEADPAVVERIGRHLIIGFEPGTNLKALVEKKAIAGLFITDQNVRRRSVEEVRAQIDELQTIRAAQGLAPLIIAADQEGGAVSRLSPPLKHQPALARSIAKAKDDAEREQIVRAYAAEQASELTRIGVTMNFAPVVDLKLDSTRRDDGETRLATRAIAADPDLVAKIAGWYCDTLATTGIMCTLKHFPGLGRVGIDTHRTAGEIKATASQLRVRDWVPYTRLMNRPNVATMLAHVRLPEIDKLTPASYSDRVIRVLLRGEWGHDGILITDDFSMGAVVRSKAGIGGAAVAALDAGADLVLISFSDKHLNTVLAALIEADSAGRLDRNMRETSAERIARVMSQFREIAAKQ